MPQFKASNVTISMSQSEWKGIQTLIRTVYQQPDGSNWAKWGEQIVQGIDNAQLEAQRLNEKQTAFSLAPTKWTTLQGFLRPTGTMLKKDNFKDQKERAIGIIQQALDAARHNVIVTTGDLTEAYEIIGPVYFQVSNKGLFSNELERLTTYYNSEIQQMRSQGQIGNLRTDWGFLYGEYSVGQSYFERAFFVAVQEIKKRAMLLDADAVIGMRQDIDLDTTGFQHFYLQMYGTAVKLVGGETVSSIPKRSGRETWEYSDLMAGRVNPTQPSGQPTIVIKLTKYTHNGTNEQSFPDLMSALMQMGKDGWELVGVHAISHGSAASETHWTFKRPL
jgi:uncharacterized protein YbjQ (UPF0145 family)